MIKFKKIIKKFSKSRKAVIGFLIFVYPFGVYLMWKGKHFNPDLRWMITLFWLIATLFIAKPVP